MQCHTLEDGNLLHIQNFENFKSESSKVSVSLAVSSAVIHLTSFWMSWDKVHRGTAPCIPNFRIGWRWVVSFMSQPLYPWGKIPWYPLDRKLGASQSQSGHCGEEKNLLALPGINGHPAHRLSLQWLSYPGVLSLSFQMIWWWHFEICNNLFL
jgi:hypothetical protein